MYVFLEEVGNDFAVCFACKGVFFFRQVLFERQKIVDHAVVDNGDASIVGEVGVRVFLGDVAVCCPAGVSDE